MLARTAEKLPNHEWLGTKKGDVYEWITFRDGLEIAKNLSLGIKALDLAPQVEAEGKQWRFCGIQAKNRWEWICTEVANFHQGVTSVALYDTLGADATRFIIDQTKLATVSMSNDQIEKICKLKQEDAASDNVLMGSLKNLIAFTDISDSEKKAADEAGIALYTFDQVIAKGKGVADPSYYECT